MPEEPLLSIHSFRLKERVLGTTVPVLYYTVLLQKGFHFPFSENCGLANIEHKRYFSFVLCLKKNQNTPRPSEHPPVRGKRCLLFEGVMLWLIFFSAYCLATEENTVTQQVSHRPMYQMRIPIVVTKRYQGQRNGSHHGDNPLLRPTGMFKLKKNLNASKPSN